ncbi:tail fiber domain-containing protein [uncultured Bacteroides sp.]|uniref:tail fiber domain-containing protein n=1 Tax=uncultured Bacteroides sp. TaxID=162156 RepID=UPI002AA6B2E2|nr:tail fiber domain-containing protein [uncultured Bacteroides sp.]
MKTIIIKSFLAITLLLLCVSANAQLKLDASGYLTYGSTTPYHDGTKYYNMTFLGNMWIKGPNSGHFFQIDTNAAATRLASHYDQVVFYNTGTGVYNSIQVKNVYNYSDIRAKKNIQMLSKGMNSINKLTQLNPVQYEFQDNADKSVFKVGGNGEEIGLLAQEVEKVLPNLVLTDPDGNKLINYTAIIPVLIDAIKTLNEEVNTLKSK